MGSKRDRIMLSPLASTPLLRLQTSGRAIPTLWSALADLTRGDGTGGVLIQHQRTQLYALWTGVGSIETLPQHKVVAALAALATRPQPTP